MSTLEDIVDLTIVVTSATLTRVGFGTPLLLVNKVPAGWGTAKVRTFSKLSELTDLGFTSSDVAYKMVQTLKAQAPATKKFKIAKRNALTAQTIAFECKSAVLGDKYHVDIALNNGTTTAVDYTVPGAATVTTVATAIELLVEAVTGVASVAAVGVITITPETAGVGNLVNLKNWTSNFEITDNTPDPGVAAELDAALAADGDWYGVLLDSQGKAETVAAAAWVEANEKLLVANTSDVGTTLVGTTTDVMSVLKAAAYKRTACILNFNELLGFTAVAWMSHMFTFDAGRASWSFKTLPGITFDALTTGQRTSVLGKNGNLYVQNAGKNHTYPGKVASGEWLDITHGLDWFKAEMQLQVFATISSLPKVPFTKAGMNTIEAAIRGVINAAVKRSLIADDGKAYVSMPNIDDIDPVTKAARLLPDVVVGGTLAGAINTTKITATVSS